MKKIKFIIISLIILMVLSTIGIYIYIKLSPKIIINNANKISFYDNNNIVFFSGTKDNEWVDLDDISQNLINCTIYTEDKNFYKHFGFDFLRIISALYSNITTHSNSQGASTITQQYAKNMFLDFDKTWKRKWDEAWYTLRIEANYSKKEILEGYLNTINYGHGQYGIKAASKYYFNKDCKDLTLAEASILAGIPKAPSKYSPVNNIDEAKKRQKFVLNNLVNNNIISNEEMKHAFDEEVNIIGKNDDVITSNINYYTDAVLEELKKIDSIPKEYSDVGGLKVYTNFDSDVQRKLEQNIEESFPEDSSLQVASVVMNPDNGGISALVGGRDYEKSSYNRATSSKRQVGSTMKPYLYYSALENGFTASTSFISEKTTFNLDNGKTYSPKNYNDIYANKPISMAAAVAYSDNIYAIKTNIFLGEDNLINMAKRVGIKDKLESVSSLPLGTKEINIISMAAGYSSFANLGYKVEGHLIKKVISNDGDVLYEKKSEKNLVLNPSLAFILNNILTATYDPLYIDYNYPTAISLNGKLRHTYSLKSGTTSYDNWNIGYNKKTLCAVWVGNDDNKELTKKDYKYAQNIWYKTVEYIEKDMEDKDVWYEKPNNVVGVLVEPISGKPSLNQEENKKLMYYLKGTEPKGNEPVFDEIEKK